MVQVRTTASGKRLKALYSPQFTKYTPGAANYERIVTGQWNSNVAEIGTQAGGTGTLRSIRLIGGNTEAPAGQHCTVLVDDTGLISLTGCS